MVDFSRLGRWHAAGIKLRDVTLRCCECGEEATYTGGLPEHMKRHTQGAFGQRVRCGGRLEEAEPTHCHFPVDSMGTPCGERDATWSTAEGEPLCREHAEAHAASLGHGDPTGAKHPQPPREKDATMAYDDDSDIADVDDYLNEKTASGGGFGRATYLKDGWKDKPGYIDVWLYTRIAPKMVVRHPWRRIQEKTDSQTKQKVREVWSDNWVCLEERSVLSNRFRDKETGEREKPFLFCPFCRLTEAVRRAVREKKLSWVEPIFRIEADDPDKAIVIHAGGFYKGYKNVEPGSPQAKELADAKIKLRTPKGYQLKPGESAAFMEEGLAKEEGVFLVVDHDKPGDGLQVYIGAGSLWQKVQHMIKQTRTQAMPDESKGNPFKHPYCVRWVFDDKAGREKGPQFYYDSMAMPNRELTPAIEKLIRMPKSEDGFGAEGGPSIAPVMAPNDPEQLLASFKKWGTKALHAAIGGDAGWAEIFNVPKRQLPNMPPPRKPRQEGARSSSSATEPAGSVEPPKVEKIKCDGPRKGPECDEMLFPWQEVCPKCKTAYDVQPEDKEAGKKYEEELQTYMLKQKAAPPEEEPEKPRQRAPRGKAAAEPPKEQEKPKGAPVEGLDFETDDDSIPF